MKILSMTATFGKLENQTLTLSDGIQIIQAPNEWGKSTWCAFIMAMLYGIDTRERSKSGTLADKEHYAPWSGSPMSGRMEILWNGKKITLERSTKGRVPMGVFRAYETETGIPVTQLTAENCGEQLLGVEKEVYKRAGFLRLSDMAVTQDDALRSRLNALVTTGDESGTADTLAEKLRELRNKVRSNRSNGLLPQAEMQRSQLEDKLRDLRELQAQIQQLQARQLQLQQQQEQLNNHADALAYAESLSANQNYQTAQAAVSLAQEKVRALETQCAAIPDREILRSQQAQLWQLRERRDALHTQQPPMQPQPHTPLNCFRDLDATEILRRTQADHAIYLQAQTVANKKISGILGILLALSGIAMLLIPHWIGKAAGAATILTGIVLYISNSAMRKRATNTLTDIAARYAPLDCDQWIDAAQRNLDEQKEYESRIADYRTAFFDYQHRTEELEKEILTFTQGSSLAAKEQQLSDQLAQRSALENARKAAENAAQTLTLLQGTCKQVSPPRREDSLTLSAEQTRQALASCAAEKEHLRQQLGLCMGQMEKLGDETALSTQLAEINNRIEKLNLTLDALNLAQDTLTQATAELQRRFAPQISHRALSFFREMTAGRYDRLTLGTDFTIHAGANNESVLHEALWRSEGTMDQLYLALRLAVAEALTPDAPLVLDDALVRFDDQRLTAAMTLLRELAQNRQVILFTCQGREAATN